MFILRVPLDGESDCQLLLLCIGHYCLHSIFAPSCCGLDEIDEEAPYLCVAQCLTTCYDLRGKVIGYGCVYAARFEVTDVLRVSNSILLRSPLSKKLRGWQRRFGLTS